MRDRSRRGLGALLVAVGGVLVGHALTYRLVAPSAHARETLLAGSGHAYLAYANDLALILALAAIATMFLGRLTGAGRGRAPAATRRAEGLPDRTALVLRLALFQTVAFTTMEGLERITAGDPLGGLLHHGLLPVGLAIQMALAVAVAVLIRWLLRTADSLALRLAGAAPAPAAPLAVTAPDGIDLVRSIARSAVGLRGPPVLPAS